MILDQGASFISSVLHDDRPHLIEKNLAGHSPEEAEGLFKALNQTLHVLAGVEATVAESTRLSL